MPYLNLRPSQVKLDPANPRLPDGTSSDREAINRLLDEGADALISLARDMAQTGQTNPAELPIAIKDGSKYLVLEGNRRFAALKLLKDPELADDEAHKRAFRRAAALGMPPKTVFTLVSVSREEAEHWVVLRHTGENSGVGVRRWSAGQTATHRRRANKSVDTGTIRSITIADELEEVYATDSQIVSLIREVRREKLTNIGRFFSSDVLAEVHMSIRQDERSSIQTRSVWARHNPDVLREFVRWAFDYILKNSVDAYKNREIRAELLSREDVAVLLPNPNNAMAAPFRLADFSRGGNRAGDQDSEEDSESEPPAGHPDDNRLGDESSPEAEDESSPGVSEDDAGDQEGSEQLAQSANGGSADSTGPSITPQPDRKAKREARPTRFQFEGLRLPNHPPSIQRLLKECRTLNVEEVPGIACIMTRVIVELAVSSQPVLNLSKASERDSLKKKILAVLRYLDPNIDDPPRRDKGLDQTYLETDNLGVQYLNSFLHNPMVYPDQHLARRFDNAFRPLLERLDGEL